MNAGPTRKPIKRRAMAEINIVPYLDVMLVLLVIFMITAPLLSQGVEVDLPQASAEPLTADADEPLVLTVDQQGLYYLNIGNEEEVVAAEVMMARVAAVLRRKPKTPVMVRGDRNASYGDVVKAMTRLQAAGAPSVGLITESD
ncbi:Tol biopolymer transport system, TolR protein [hydrothermal vent metagenome]|uniref:Tol biopolymer transport system, TolR protein n=1 Tax=hydrothermal vent metagenome TaxID=652676 RepID=A0A3B0Z468_9ZZZZ